MCAYMTYIVFLVHAGHRSARHGVFPGTMSFDDKANKYLDWWSKDPSDPRSNITLRRLLTFQSGVASQRGTAGRSSRLSVPRVPLFFIIILPIKIAIWGVYHGNDIYVETTSTAFISAYVKGRERACVELILLETIKQLMSIQWDKCFPLQDPL